jgi:hypothetical protein
MEGETTQKGAPTAARGGNLLFFDPLKPIFAKLVIRTAPVIKATLQEGATDL